MSSPKNGALKGPGIRSVEASDGELDDSSRMTIQPGSSSSELQRSLAEIKGQAQFLLYLADQPEQDFGLSLAQRCRRFVHHDHLSFFR